MKRIDLMAEKRERVGKGAARTLRRENKVPAVLYAAGRSQPLTIDRIALSKILHGGTSDNILLNLKIQGDSAVAEHVALLREHQTDPITDEVLHVDLFEVALDSLIRLRVPIEVKGEPAGVKEGGVLTHNLREIEVECRVADIPDRITIDAGPLAIGDAIHVKDLPVSGALKILDNPDQVVVAVAAPISEAKLEELLAAPKEVKEPEVIGVKEKVEGEEAAPEAAAKPGEKPAGKPAEKAAAGKGTEKPPETKGGK